MSEPIFGDLLDENERIDDQNEVILVNVAARSISGAAYWQGLCEGQAETIAILKDQLKKAERRTGREE
jgi:hypothetical protein